MKLNLLHCCPFSLLDAVLVDVRHLPSGKPPHHEDVTGPCHRQGVEAVEVSQPPLLRAAPEHIETRAVRHEAVIRSGTRRGARHGDTGPGACERVKLVHVVKELFINSSSLAASKNVNIRAHSALTVTKP